MIEESLVKPKLIRFISIVVFFSMIPLIASSTIQFLYHSPDTGLMMSNIFGELDALIFTLEKYGLPAQLLIDISPLPRIEQIVNMENIMSISIITAFLFSVLFWANTHLKIRKVNAFIRQAEEDLNREINRIR